MIQLICRNKVADFDRWKRVFDSHAEAQRTSGLRVQHVWRNIDDPGEVLMLFQVDNLKKARAFVSSPKVPEAQQASGLIDKPEMYFVR